jgi:hypothetical protein|tara:strand:+ start:112 stop:399 length:288 start_codon:yes stop_codon:yes gene_type:complete
MINIKINDKVKTNQMTLKPLSENQIVKYKKHRCPITKKVETIGYSKNGHTDVMVRDWDKSADWIVVKITEKRIGVVHKNNPNGQPTFLAHHFIKK